MPQQHFQVDLRLDNPNDIALAIDRLSFKLEVNGVALAEGLSDRSITLPGLGEARVPVTTPLPSGEKDCASSSLVSFW